MGGRAEEMAVLRARLEGAGGGGRQAVLLEGEAGIGKTRLVDAVVADASARRFEVLAGAADELFDDRPAGVLVDAFGLAAVEADPERAVAAEAVGLTEPVRTDSVASRSQAVEAFEALTERLARRRPVLLAVEDLQWADPLSLLTLRALWRRLAHLPLVFVITFRSAPLDAELATCLTEMEREGAARLTVGPLKPAVMTEIARAHLGAVPGPALLGLLDRAGGNPLLALEVLRGLEAEELLVHRHGTVEVTTTGMPPSLVATVLKRLAVLDEPARQALRMAAVLGARFTAWQLSAQLDLTPVELLGVVDQLVRVGLLTQDGDHLAFRHDMVREAVYLDLPASLRVALHLDVAQRLAADGASAAVVARHYVHGGLDHPSFAALTPARVAAGAEPESRPELLAERAVAELFRGQLAAARRDADAALTVDRASSTPASATATVVAAFEATLRGRLDEGASQARAALDLAATSTAPGAFPVASVAPFCLTRAGYLPEALEIAGRAWAAAKESGSADEAASLQAVQGVLQFHAGQWEQAEAHLAAALTAADEAGVPVLMGACWPSAVRAHLAARRGDPSLADAVLVEAPAEPTDDGAHLGFEYVCWTRAVMADARGRPALALDWLRAAWQLDRSLGLRSEPVTYAAELARFALEAGDRACAHELTAELEDTAARSPHPTIEGVALHCRGLVAADPERLEAAVEHLHAAGEPLPRALASEDGAGHLADADPPRAVELALEALDVFEQLGAVRDAARVKALLRRLGVRRGERGRRQRPATGWDSLTPAELKVTGLVMEGLTNREIGARLYISPRTVGTHISHALSKLGLRSRVELAAEMTRRA